MNITWLNIVERRIESTPLHLKREWEFDHTNVETSQQVIWMRQ
jgi:hypothetical protein